MADFDLFVIGGGSGGVACARRAASYGARVGIAEVSRYGGTCVIRGCVPKKLMHYAGDFSEAPSFGRGYGFSGEMRLDFEQLLAARNQETARLEGVYRSMLDKAGVARFDAKASLLPEREGDDLVIEVEGRRLTSPRVLIATGGRPRLPDHFHGIELAVTSDHLLEDTYAFPRRLVVVGAGYIGVEQASIFRALGAETTLVLRGDYPLRGFEGDLRRELAAEMQARGLRIRNNCRIEAIHGDGDALVLATDRGPIEADMVVMATGRTPKPQTEGVGVVAHDVRLDGKGAICVNPDYESNVHGIFAIGDCCDHTGVGLDPSQYDLTPVAIAEGRALADRLFKDSRRRVVYETIPTAVFGFPEASSAGLSEAGAKEQGHDVAIFRTSFRPMVHSLTGRPYKMMMKLVVDRPTDRVLGCHIVGDDAAEIIQGFAVALSAGVTKRQFDDTVALHPTSAEELVTMYQAVAG